MAEATSAVNVARFTESYFSLFGHSLVMSAGVQGHVRLLELAYRQMKLQPAHHTLTLLSDELEGNDAGAMAIATDLASALFIMMLRQHLAYPPVEGLLALLGQRATAKAVVAMLRDPSYEWTLDELAARAVVSRATLIRSFSPKQLAVARSIGASGLGRVNFAETARTAPLQRKASIRFNANSSGREERCPYRAPNHG